MNIAEQKKILRTEARSVRAKLKLAAPDAARAIAKNFIIAIPLQSNAIVAGYVAAKDEMDPRELITALRQRGVSIALPRVAAKGTPLVFHLWEKDALPVKGTYELYEAASNWPHTWPAIVLVPLLAFDADGYRLGYGGGYYDRTLAKLRQSQNVRAIGIAYAGQEVARMPHAEHDQKLDMVVTELGARKFR